MQAGRLTEMGPEEFSVVVVGSDLAVDVRDLITGSPAEVFYDCSSHLPGACAGDDDGFSDIEALRAFRVGGFDKAGNRILIVVGKFYPAAIISSERLKRYVLYKLYTELPEGPFCILYMHSSVQSEDNNPGMFILRWIYEELSCDVKERFRVVYFLHPGLRSRLVFATLGRLFLSGGLYWKIKYLSRLQYLWDDIKKGQVEIPEFVQKHDEVIEHRPLTDYGIEPDPLHLTGVPPAGYPFGRCEDKLALRGYY